MTKQAAAKIIAHELRRLAKAIERDTVNEDIVSEADHLVDAFRNQEAYESICEVCGDKPSTQGQQFSPFCSRDCWDSVHCECCGEACGECLCIITTHDGVDRETGPYSDRGCSVHACRVG